MKPGAHVATSSVKIWKTRYKISMDIWIFFTVYWSTCLSQHPQLGAKEL